MECTAEEQFPRRRLNSQVPEFHPNPKAPPSTHSAKALSTSNPQKPATFSVAPVAPSTLPPAQNYQFKNDFPRLEDYSSIEKIKRTFVALRSINSTEFVSEESDFVMIRVMSLDDLHKSLKYGLWASADMEKNHWLAKKFQSNLRNGTRTVLVYKIDKESICGVAELSSGFSEKRFDLWWNYVKLPGYFELSWLYVKNMELKAVHPEELRRAVEKIGDFESIPREFGWQILHLIHTMNFYYLSSLFSFFKVLDCREDTLMNSRQVTDFQIKLQKKEFKGESMIATSKTHQTHFSPDEKRNAFKRNSATGKLIGKKISEKKIEEEIKPRASIKKDLPKKRISEVQYVKKVSE